MIYINYTDLKCGVCSKNFDENDDVVVCPDCGTPMHRACYKENNGCPNQLKHSESFVYEDFDKIKETAQSATSDKAAAAFVEPKSMICPFCGEENKTDASFCNRCGSKLVKPQLLPDIKGDVGESAVNASVSNRRNVNPDGFESVMTDILAGVPAETEFEEDVNAGDLACFVSVNTPYYFKAFTLIKNKANKFNFSALIFSAVWFLYRKLYKIGALIFAVEALLYTVRFYFTKVYSKGIMEQLLAGIGVSFDKISSLTTDQYIQLSVEMQNLPVNDQLVLMIPSIMFVLQIVVMIVCGFIGNRIYYRHCVKNVRWIKEQAKEQSADKKDVARVMLLKGGVNPFVAGALCLLYFYIILL